MQATSHPDNIRSLTVLAVSYLNTAPLIEGLATLEGLDLQSCAPALIAPRLIDRQADVGLASIIDAARHPLAILPVGMIGCEGPTLTVRVFSRLPFARATSLHADTESHTSVVLAQLILQRHFGVRPRLIDFDARERIALDGSRPAPPTSLDDAWPETVLLIGDKVINDPPPAHLYPHQLDLGEAWHEWTGLPFVYAAWMTRADHAGEPAIHHAATLLDRQRRHNQTRLAWLIATHAPRHRWPIDLASRYLADLLRFELGPREREAAQRFIDEAAAAGLAPARTLTWIEPVHSTPSQLASV